MNIKWIYIKMQICKLLLAISVLCLLISCSSARNTKKLLIATSAEYPPFEYMHQGKVVGFDIDLAKLIGAKLGYAVEISNMQFSSILPALSLGKVDMAISTITVTQERAQQFTFSKPYFYEQMAAVYQKPKLILAPQDLCGKKVAAQLGTTMAIWLKAEVNCAQIYLTDSNPLAIEALKTGKIDVVIMDGTQALIFASKNKELASSPIFKAKDGYAVAFPKGSKLRAKVNAIIKSLQDSGEIKQLEHKWLGK